MEIVPKRLQQVLDAGGNTTLIVWADVDDNMESPEKLKQAF